MFGAHGLYVDKVFVAIVASERLYLKVDDTTRPRFEAQACEPFVYNVKGQAVSLGYFSAPQDAMDSPALMLVWARLALEAALRARAARPTPAKRVRPVHAGSAASAERAGAKRLSRKSRSRKC